MNSTKSRLIDLPAEIIVPSNYYFHLLISMDKLPELSEKSMKHENNDQIKNHYVTI